MLYITPSIILETGTKLSFPVTSLSREIVNFILYLSAPGAEVFGTAPWLSNSPASSDAETTSSTTLNPKISSSIVSLYLDITFDWSSVIVT